MGDFARSNESGPVSSWSFPHRYDAAILRVAVLVGVPDTDTRARGLESLLLDVLQRERIPTTRRSPTGAPEIGFELFSEAHRLICVWSSTRMTAPMLERLAPPRVLGPRSTPVIAIMSDVDTACPEGVIVLARHAILDVFEGRDTFRDAMEARRSRLKSGERVLLAGLRIRGGRR